MKRQYTMIVIAAGFWVSGLVLPSYGTINSVPESGVKQIDRDAAIAISQDSGEKSADAVNRPRFSATMQISNRPSSHRSASSAQFEVGWLSINGGGGTASGGDYAAGMSVGQASVGDATSTSYDAGIGFWHVVTADTSGGNCECPSQSDFDGNGVLDAADLNGLIDALFFGGPNPQDPACPNTRADFNDDGVPDAVDLNQLIDHLFFGGPAPVDPCAAT